MKFVCLSDPHGYHRLVKVPAGDVLIFAGDLTVRGEIVTVRDFNMWLGELPHKYKIVIAGNHDIGFEKEREEYEALITNATYLRDCEVNIAGLRIFGSPWTPWFYGDSWVFNRPRGVLHPWDEIPRELDILVTHGPSNRVLDYCGDYAGDLGLTMRLKDMGDAAPKFHVFGHIHEGYGRRKVGPTEYLNVSVLDGRYRLVNEPQTFEM